MNVLLILFLSVFFLGCSSDTKSTCTNGEQVSCPCVGAPDGVQQCVDGAYNTCQCPQVEADMSVDISVVDDSGAEPDLGPTEPDIMQRMVGLWIGSAGQTPLGNFPLMNMDMRPVDDGWLFSRVDLDVDNALRFAFYHETLNGEDHLVFRNGGLFMGMERDTRTVLMDFTADTFTFCEPDRGCDYLEATWTFDSETDVVLDVKVGQMPHLLWDATRVETRDAPSPFPSSTEPIGDGTTPFPTMPTLDITANVSEAIGAESFVWVVFSDTGCGITGRDCQPSRSMRVTIPAGDTTGTARIDQIHEATYFVNSIWDRNGNFQTAPFPDSGDQVAIPDATVTVSGAATVTTTTSFDIP